jgi:hypothetical protein
VFENVGYTTSKPKILCLLQKPSETLQILVEVYEENVKKREKRTQVLE